MLGGSKGGVRWSELLKMLEAAHPDLRLMYRALLAGAAALIVITVLALGLASSRGFSEWVLAAWVPAAPFVAWVLRERYCQADAVSSMNVGFATACDLQSI
jgi:hypothetical protein